MCEATEELNYNPFVQIWILNHHWACGDSKASLSVRQHLEREMERMVKLTCSDFAPEINFPCSSVPLVIKTILSDRLMTGWLSSLMPSSASLACWEGWKHLGLLLCLSQAQMLVFINLGGSQTDCSSSKLHLLGKILSPEYGFTTQLLLKVWCSKQFCKLYWLVQIPPWPVNGDSNGCWQIQWEIQTYSD